MLDKRQTLFARIGGEKPIAELIDDFYDRVLADPELKPFFKNIAMDKLRRMQREFFSAALDGPITYTGKPLSHVHHGRGITKRHFALYVDALIDTLRDHEITGQDVQDIIGRINTYADEITGDVGSVG
ncbi:MAG: group 1 truncated hemoglobin [Desulfobacterales bacterium]|nr:group 1 truncated hemoglobin [Desulfobacterales bacterium]